jgi:hypothetical protein
MHHKLHSMRVKLNFSMLCPSIAGLFDVRLPGYDPFLRLRSSADADDTRVERRVPPQ